MQPCSTPLSPKLRVLVTRPAPAGTLLCERIRSQGGQATFFPTLAFADTPNKTALHDRLSTIGQQHWLIFTSPQAVDTTLSLIQQRWLTLTTPPHLAAIGQGTANKLRAAHYLVHAPEKQANSEALLALPALQSIANQSIMIIRGAGGRDYLARVLTKRGAIVSHAIAYQRIQPTGPIPSLKQLLSMHKINVIVATSCDSVSHLQQLSGGENHLKSLPLIVASQRIALFAKARGFQCLWVACGADNDALLDCLSQHHETMLAAKKEITCMK